MAPLCAHLAVAVALALLPLSRGSLAVWESSTACCRFAGSAATDCSGCLQADTSVPVVLPPGGGSQWHFPAPWLTWVQHAHTEVHFELELCHGAAELHLQRAAPLGANPQLNESSAAPLLRLSVPWDHANFWTRAVGVANSSALLRVRVDDSAYPVLPADRTIALAANDDPDELLLAGDSIAMIVGFGTAARAGNHSYRVYYSEARGGPCGGVPREQCLLTTACGVQHAMHAATPWFDAPAGGNTSVRVGGLAQGQAYAFQVLARSPAGHMAPYLVAMARPSFSRDSAVHSAETVFLVGVSAGGAFAALLLCVLVAKLRIDWGVARGLEVANAEAKTAEGAAAAGEAAAGRKASPRVAAAVQASAGAPPLMADLDDTAPPPG